MVLGWRFVTQITSSRFRTFIQLYCDNKTACDIAHNLVQHDHMKQVGLIVYIYKKTR